ncbi:FAD:protein FMN transferase [Desulfosporosinus youngiae]|uniref:FAD:protein FMN transferase n=1 Tax=Desulfosporosinus youngiae DSM 17734 TaxID=768710 RepID=H5Y1J7_9FIRM|nr:FAD:protein FMN transferase [Desulfosporosinus youngiae]EHQ87610.1 membrane-associated lipoprotein involved in thiamine biosynthesis [Desulfosporosinus youngiae DSM 17734]
MLLKFKNRNRKGWAAIVLVILAAGILTACNSDKNESFEADGFAMGTVISQKVYGVKGQAVMDEVMEKINYLDGLLTFNAPEGDIFNLNQNAGIKNVELNPETVKIIKKAQQVSELSNGAFDVTIGPVVKSWGIGTEQEHIPGNEELQKLLSLVNYQDIYINESSVGLKRAGQMVDLGGIAKGYAGDVAKEIYKEKGIHSAYINLGGNVVTVGNKPDGSPWKAGIRNPRPVGQQSGQVVGIVKVTDKAVVTAGDEQRYFEKDGQRYHHILDPKTGYPAKSDLMSVTLVTDSSLEADALDTAVFILGLEKGKELLRQYGGVEAVFITTDKKIYVTEGLKGNFEFHDESKQFEYIE